MTKLFWHIAPNQPGGDALVFEIVEIEKTISFPKELEPKFYRELIKLILPKQILKPSPALLRGTIVLEEYELAAYIKRRMEVGQKHHSESKNTLRSLHIVFDNSKKI